MTVTSIIRETNVKDVTMNSTPLYLSTKPHINYTFFTTIEMLPLIMEPHWDSFEDEGVSNQPSILYLNQLLWKEAYSGYLHQNTQDYLLAKKIKLQGKSEYLSNNTYIHLGDHKRTATYFRYQILYYESNKSRSWFHRHIKVYVALTHYSKGLHQRKHAQLRKMRGRTLD